MEIQKYHFNHYDDFHPSINNKIFYKKHKLIFIAQNKKKIFLTESYYVFFRFHVIISKYKLNKKEKIESFSQWNLLIFYQFLILFIILFKFMVSSHLFSVSFLNMIWVTIILYELLFKKSFINQFFKRFLIKLLMFFEHSVKIKKSLVIYFFLLFFCNFSISYFVVKFLLRINQ